MRNLLDMGFEEQDIMQALKISGNHQESAVCLAMLAFNCNSGYVFHFTRYFDQFCLYNQFAYSRPVVD